MGGSSKGGALQQSEIANTTALTQIAQGQAANSNSLFSAAFPGFQQSEDFSTALASGDPGKISQVIAPAVQQVTQATQGAKQNIMNNAPSGGEKNLALESADVSQGAQVGALASQGFTQAQNSLATLAGQGVSQSQNASGLAVSGLNSANQGLGSIFNQNMEQKGATLGAFGGLAGDASTLGAAAIYA